MKVMSFAVSEAVGGSSALGVTVSVKVSAGPMGVSLLGASASVAIAVGLGDISVTGSEGVVGDWELQAEIISKNNIQKNVLRNVMTSCLFCYSN
jgi:hypothetical protein